MRDLSIPEFSLDSLPPFLRAVRDAASARGLPLYVVGGFARDLLLGRPTSDLDLVVEGDAVALARALAAAYGGKVTAHSKFGTAQWLLPESLRAAPHRSLDFISARSETYKHPAALPTVRPGTLADDLRRRDFTINTLAIRLDGGHFGELRDDLGGLDDLRAGLVRVLHPRSFVDDPTRIFRAVRYEKRYGFRIEPGTLALLRQALPWIGRLSAERVRHELDLILAEENAASMLARLAELKALVHVHPALAWEASTRQRVKKAAQAPAGERVELGWMLWLMGFPRPTLEQIDKRLHFQAGLRGKIFSASALFAALDSLTGRTPSQCVAFLDDFPPASIRAVQLAAPRGEARRNLGHYLETWRRVRPKATGHTLKKLGLEPGPEYQKILRRLRDAWLDGEVGNEAEERALLARLIR